MSGAAQNQDTCVVRTPEGATPAALRVEAPKEVVAGQTFYLTLRVTHQKGERVLIPDAVQGAFYTIAQRGHLAQTLRLGVDEPHIELTQTNGETVLRIPFVALPTAPGLQREVVPALPIEVERARGDRMHLCTQPFELQVKDPTADEQMPAPRPNAPTLPQREPWQAMHLGLLAAALLVLVLVPLGLYLRRRKANPANLITPPKRPPWDLALRDLRQLEADLVKGKVSLHDAADRAGDIVRRYLGERFAFDGLGATSAEVLRHVTAQASSDPSPTVTREDADALRAELQGFLQGLDLVKFAGVSTTQDECRAAIVTGKHIVEMTTPHSMADDAADRGARHE
jgi:hypothetical protein